MDIPNSDLFPATIHPPLPRRFIWACPVIADCIATVARVITTLIISSDLYFYCGNDSSVSAFLSHFYSLLISLCTKIELFSKFINLYEVRVIKHHYRLL